MLVDKTHQTVKNLLKRLEAYESDGSGSECNFIKIGRIGYKIYWYESTRDFAYDAQKCAHKINLAPKPYKKFEFIRTIDSQDIKLYCYTTELAVVDRKWTNAKMSFAGIEKRIAINEIEYLYNDDHCGNIGELNGRLVIVDWGPCGVIKCTK
jgi:hypothetical protein